jgi:hypothetical protein
MLRRIVIALMMEAASSSKTSVNIYQTARRSISEDRHLYVRRREKLKSHTIIHNSVAAYHHSVRM